MQDLVKPPDVSNTYYEGRLRRQQSRESLASTSSEASSLTCSSGLSGPNSRASEEAEGSDEDAEESSYDDGIDVDEDGLFC